MKQSRNYILSSNYAKRLKEVLCDYLKKILTDTSLYVIISREYYNWDVVLKIMQCFYQSNFRMFTLLLTNQTQVQFIISDIKSKNMFQVFLFTNEDTALNILQTAKIQSMIGKNYFWMILGNLFILTNQQFNFTNTNIHIVNFKLFRRLKTIHQIWDRL